MDDERYERGMPVLERQGARAPVVAAAAPTGLPAGVQPAGHGGVRPGGPPRSVPETRPTPLQKHYILLSAPALVLGAVAITALELGAAPGSAIVKVCVLVGAPLLAVANADAIVRIWRSAWAWMGVDRARGVFRLAWVMAGVILYVLLLGAAWLVLTA